MTTGIGWTVVLPLKGGSGAKSRLGGPPGLAAAIALDSLATVLAADQVRRVLVVTPDPELAAQAVELGAERLTEEVPGARPGLAGAIATGLAASAGPVGVLLGDLPALRPGDLDAALAVCAGYGHAFVPDAEGTGTVLLTGLRPELLVPRFGAGSAAAHAATGAVRLELDLPRLRRDVDTPADLAAARALGLGPRTAAVVG